MWPKPHLTDLCGYLTTAAKKAKPHTFDRFTQGGCRCAALVFKYSNRACSSQHREAIKGTDPNRLGKRQ